MADENEIDLDDLDGDSSNDIDQCTLASTRVAEAFASGIAKDDNEIDLGDDDSGVDAEQVAAKAPVGTSGFEDDNEIDIGDDDSGANAEQVAAQPLETAVPRRKRIKLPPPVNSM